MSNTFVTLIKKAVGIQEKKAESSCCSAVPAGLIPADSEKQEATKSSCCGK